MWTRSLLKSNAKVILSRNYWHIWVGCFIAMLLGGGLAGNIGVSSSYRYSADSGAASGSFLPFYGDSSQVALAFLGVFLIVFLIGILAGLCLAAFVCLPVQVGLCRFLMESRSGNSPYATIFSLFRRDNYLHTVCSMFLTRLKVFLWSLLLLVPGVIKGYEYYFVPFLLAENPNLSRARAQELSSQMTNGEKGKMFVLDLSFYGWYFLVALASTLCISMGGTSPFYMLVAYLVALFGSLCLAPYYSATFAELYAAMREKALAIGMTDAHELGGFLRY